MLFEQHLDYSAYIPEGFETGDLVIVADGALTVIDLKYGKGVAAERNPQMMRTGWELWNCLMPFMILIRCG